jgi:hypothetical protein
MYPVGGDVHVRPLCGSHQTGPLAPWGYTITKACAPRAVTFPFASVVGWPLTGSTASQSTTTSADAPGPAAAIWACRSAYWPATAAARPAGSPGIGADGPCQVPPSQLAARLIPTASPVTRSIEPSGRWSGQRGAEICGSP